MRLQLPFAWHRVTSLHGWRVLKLPGRAPFDDFHNGLDFGVVRGTPIAAPADGRRIASGRGHHLYGNWLEYEHGVNPKGEVVTTRYHGVEADSIDSAPRIIRQGEHFAKSHIPGAANGDHLHWEVWVAGKRTDPKFAPSIQTSYRAPALPNQNGSKKMNKAQDDRLKRVEDMVQILFDHWAFGKAGKRSDSPGVRIIKGIARALKVKF